MLGCFWELRLEDDRINSKKAATLCWLKHPFSLQYKILPNFKQSISMLHLCFSLLQLLLSPLSHATLIQYCSIFSAPPPHSRWSLTSSMHKMERFLSWESPTEVVFCLWDACTLGYRTWKGLYQMSPGTAGEGRMVIRLRQFNAFLGDLTDLIFTASVLQLSVLSKLNSSQLITEYSVYPSAEIQAYRNADHAKRYIWRHWEVYFHNKKIKSFQVLWAFKRAYKIREHVTILALNLSVPRFLLCKMKTNYFLS